MEKLKSLSKRVSHAPAAEAWDTGTHFPSLEVSNPFPVSEFPQNLKFKAAWASWTHRQCSSEDCRGPYKTWSVQEGNKNLLRPKGAGSQCRVTGKEHSSRGSSTVMPWGSVWDAENQDQHFCPKGTWWDSSGCCDSLWEPKWRNEDQAKGDSVLTTQNYWCRSWGEEVSPIFLLFLVGCIYSLLLTPPWRYLDAGLLWACLKGIWGWTESSG